MTLVLDDNQIKKAIKALMSHSEKTKESGATRQLFEDEGDVFNLQIALKKIPEKVSEKPVGLPRRLPVSKFRLCCAACSICVIVVPNATMRRSASSCRTPFSLPMAKCAS
jgi:hypothetical protein